MNFLVETPGKEFRVELPDLLPDGQSFPLVVNGKTFDAAWHRREAVLVLKDQNGLERALRVRGRFVQRDEEALECRVEADVLTPSAPGLFRVAFAVRPDLPGEAQRPKGSADGSSVVKSPITGKVLKVLVKKGDLVDGGSPLAIIEAMKMENRIFAPTAGKVSVVGVKDADLVQTGKELFRIAPKDQPPK